MDITSVQNARIKALLKLRASSRQRQREAQMLVEGMDEIRLALAAGHSPSVMICAPELTRKELGSTEGERLNITSAIFRKLSMRENPDGWMAVFPRPVRSTEALALRQNPLLLVLEAVEKPGNLGAVLRTADAVRVDAVMVCDRRTDVYGPNVVRASRGALFAVPIIETGGAEALEFIRRHSMTLVAASPNAGQDYTRADLRGPLAIAVGTEDAGLSDFWLENANTLVRIPMHGKVNSLNVSVAAALILYEALRQRTV